MTFRALDLVGQRFGLLVVVGDVGRKHRQVLWQCKCDCGAMVERTTASLKSTHRSSCGCAHSDDMRGANVTHGHAAEKTPTYKTWRNMIERCYRPASSGYDRYGGRGITVCDRWRSFANFLADMGDRPAGMTIDRVDNEKGYELDNCRWATWTEQQTNRRCVKMTEDLVHELHGRVEHGESIASVAARLGISQSAAYLIRAGKRWAHLAVVATIAFALWGCCRSGKPPERVVTISERCLRQAAPLPPAQTTSCYGQGTEKQVRDCLAHEIEVRDVWISAAIARCGVKP